MSIVVSIIKLFGGIALLIYGMKILSANLKQISGGRLEKILISFTDNNFKGLLTGIFITVVTQSSSATTVIVVGLVNASILKLRNAIPIIMGANIGTTITSQILRLTSLDSNSLVVLFTPEVMAPILIVIGVLVMQLAKNKRTNTIAEMIMGVGLLFTGMISMVEIASGFSELPILSEILSKLSNPILGVLAGAAITLLVQSSAATVGILQALSTTGIITYSSTIPIILGQNIGTCGTSIISSIGASKNAKRAAAVHLYFNLIGTIIFLICIYTYQHFIGFSFWNRPINMGQIANFHTLFNIVSTIILFPFIGVIEKITVLTIRDNNRSVEKEEDKGEDLSILNMLNERVSTIPNLAILNSCNVIQTMGVLAEKNFRRSTKLLNNFKPQKLDKIQQSEDAIDRLEGELVEFLVNFRGQDLSNEETVMVTALLKIESEFEKIGDCAYKFSKKVEDMYNKNIKFSDKAYSDFSKIYNITEDTVLTTIQVFKKNDLKNIIEIEALRTFIERQKEKCKNAHIQRIKEGKCNAENGAIFLELLNICEKVIEHCLNIAIATVNYRTKESFSTKQEFYYRTKAQILKKKLEEYNQKYAI